MRTRITNKLLARTSERERKSHTDKIKGKTITYIVNNEFLFYLFFNVFFLFFSCLVFFFSSRARDMRGPLSQIRVSLVASLGAGQTMFLAGIGATENKARILWKLMCLQSKNGQF